MCRSKPVSIAGYFTVLALAFASTGCSLIPSSSSTSYDTSVLQATGAPAAMNSGGSEAVFQRIKQAKSQNAIVLQVDGDEEPIRVLPLPEEGRSVNVSDLLEQTGVVSTFGSMQVRIYRDSPEQMDGVRMDVQFDGKRVRPESDYALRPGDRVQVRKESSTGLGKWLGGLVPGNAMRVLGG